jgi:hypothetical protein
MKVKNMLGCFIFPDASDNSMTKLLKILTIDSGVGWVHVKECGQSKAHPTSLPEPSSIFYMTKKKEYF